MAEDQFDSRDLDPENARPTDDTPSSDDDPRASVLRPQEMGRAEAKPIPPRIREQALPEKDDDRFFDRWVVDKARGLGERAVRQPALDQLKKTVRSFAEWRSLRHRARAETESIGDRELVASTAERIRNAEAEAGRLEASAEEADRDATRFARDIEEANERIADLRPALRGSPRWDFRLVGLANFVVFGVDFYIIQIALRSIPGTSSQHRLTALMLGMGAVVVGDVLGWMAAAGSINREGEIHRPRPATIAAVAGMLILAIWFFGELGEFREAGLRAAEQRGPDFGDPTFFTIAQILFLIAAAVSCFAYMGRRTGRELYRAQQEGLARRDQLRREVSSLKERATEAHRRAAEAPALSKAAEERIRSRERIADGKAKHDLKQGEYLESLVVPEYMRERAGVESGIRAWHFGRPTQLNVPPLLLVSSAIAGTLMAGGITYLIMGNVLTSVITGVVVAFAFALALWGRHGDEVEPERPWWYVARLFATARKPEERATDIEQIVPFDADEASRDSHANGNHSARRATRKELWEQLEKVREIINGENGKD
ncbi:MAG TPA: hypothetical protein VF009_02290 [Solirubrobacterales bacterium]